MATWVGVVTNAGKALFATWANGTTFNFDAAEGGTGTVAESALLAQTALVNKKQDISILGGERVTDGVKLTIQITAPATGYTLNQIAIKGSVDGGTRALTALFQTSDGVTIPSVTQTPDFIYKFFGVVMVSNTGAFTLTIDTSAVVSQSTLEEAIETHNEDGDAHDGQFAKLDADGKVSSNQLPDMDYIPAAAKGVAEGVAELDATGKVPSEQLPAMNYDPAGSAATVQTNLTAHTGNTSNPHSVTKAQVGLGSVDNTSDADKPVSTAQQTAINTLSDDISAVSAQSLIMARVPRRRLLPQKSLFVQILY